MPLIDAHTHLFPPAQAAARAQIAAADPTFAEMYADPAAKMADLPALLNTMAQAGLDGAVIAGFAFARQPDIDAQNAYLLQAARGHPTLYPLATINPALPGWEATASDLLASGARGFGELRPHNQGWDPLGPESHRLCGLAQDANAILLWHVSEPVGHAYPGKQGGITPAELCDLAQSFPQLRMIAAHLGGGLPFYLQMPEIKDTLTNVWFDTAASSLLYDDQSVARLVGLAGQERVLFGSDYPLLSPRRQLERLQGLLPGDVANAVCGGNARLLFSETR